MDLSIWLPVLVLIPLAGGAACWWTERLGLVWPRWIAVGSFVIDLIILLWLWAQADLAVSVSTAAPQFFWEFQRDWIPRFGISLHLGLDGLGLLLIALTIVLGLVAVLCSWREIQQHVGFFHMNLLWNLAGVIGVFMALDLFLFFLLWEWMLVPMYFLIALWGHDSPGGRGRVYAATKFFIFTQASGLIMLAAILGLVWLNHASSGIWTFNYLDLLQAQLSAQAQWWLMLGFFIAFAVKLPALPFHPWLPDAHSQAPTAGSVDLAGVLLKTGAFGLMRFSITLFPEASAQFADTAMIIGIAGIIYGASLALSQTDIKRFVAYTSISHMGFVLLGVYAGNLVAMQGVVIQMLAHGISTGALFVLCGELYERIHTREFGAMGGLATRAPRYATALMFFGLASLGLPGMGNFIGEILILFGAFQVAPVLTVLAASGLVLGAIYSLLLIQKTLHGKPASDEALEDLVPREQGMLLVLMALLLAMGLYPQPLLDTAEPALRYLVHAYAGGLP